jgi:hypothetical protein
LCFNTCRFLDAYDLKVPSGSFKYKKAAEFLMNTVVIGIKGIVQDILTAKEAAAARAASAEASVTQVGPRLLGLHQANIRPCCLRWTCMLLLLCSATGALSYSSNKLTYCGHCT